jgi:hypothetical protein
VQDNYVVALGYRRDHQICDTYGAVATTVRKLSLGVDRELPMLITSR